MQVVFLFVIFLILTLIAFPMALGMGASALLAILVNGKIPPLIVVQRIFVGLDSLPLLAIPMFLLAGNLMHTGGISRRLVQFSSALVGHFKGGLAMISVLASMIFAGISGSSTADVAAIGSIMMPAMIEKGYKKGFVVSLQSCAGTIGPIIPPSILMIIYGGITGISIGTLFLAGIVPGILVGLGLMIGSYIYAVKNNMGGEARQSFRTLLKSFWESIWALILPLVIIGGIFTGVFTATEAGMIAVVYALIVSMCIYKEIKPRDLSTILLESGMISVSILIITSMANIFGWFLAKEQFPVQVIATLTSISSNPNVIMFVIIVFFLILGCFIDTLAALIIFTPVLQPIVAQYGFDPIHFALVFIVTLLIGQVTPPVGVVLFLTASMVKIHIKETLEYLGPLLAIYVIVLLICAYSEGLVMFIPRLFFP